MLDADLRAQVRIRLTAHCQSDLQERQIERILDGMDVFVVEDNGFGARTDFLMQMVDRPEEYQAMVELICRTYYGKSKPDPHARPYAIPAVPGEAVPTNPIIHLAVDVLAAIAAGTPSLAWGMLDDRDSGRRTFRQATVLGLLLGWLRGLAIDGFPDRTKLPH
jgi:hypothetical protein